MKFEPVSKEEITVLEETRMSSTSSIKGKKLFKSLKKTTLQTLKKSCRVCGETTFRYGKCLVCQMFGSRQALLRLTTWKNNRLYKCYACPSIQLGMYMVVHEVQEHDLKFCRGCSERFLQFDFNYVIADQAYQKLLREVASRDTKEESIS
jgi:predicted RNA-binding protein YlxR (DUF448 family)